MVNIIVEESVAETSIVTFVCDDDEVLTCSTGSKDYERISCKTCPGIHLRFILISIGGKLWICLKLILS